MSALRCTFLALCFLPSAASAGSGDYAQWVLYSPSDSPFAEIRYEVTDRGPASAAIHRRRLPGQASSLHNMGLMTREAAEAVRKLLLETDALTLPCARYETPKSAALTWRFEAQQGGKKHTFYVTDPLNQKDRRYWRLFSTLRRHVRAITGGLPFQDVFYPKHEMGWLHVRSTPAGRLTLDGRDTELITPIRDLPLRAGKHQIELKSVEGSHVRRYTIRVEAGGHTRLKLSLH